MYIHINSYVDVYLENKVLSKPRHRALYQNNIGLHTHQFTNKLLQGLLRKAMMEREKDKE